MDFVNLYSTILKAFPISLREVNRPLKSPRREQCCCGKRCTYHVLQNCQTQGCTEILSICFQNVFDRYFFIIEIQDFGNVKLNFLCRDYERMRVQQKIKIENFVQLNTVRWIIDYDFMAIEFSANVILHNEIYPWKGLSSSLWSFNLFIFILLVGCFRDLYVFFHIAGLHYIAADGCNSIH